MILHLPMRDTITLEDTMRSLLGLAATAVVMSACAAAPAFAGADEAQRDSFWGSQTVAPQGSTASHGYITVDPKDAKADPNASVNVDASNPYFNHAMGTMSGPDAVASAAPSSVNNPRYTATYGTQYMKVDPRDTKVDPDASSASDKDIYFYHSMGTMSHP
jgi:hypothetical protein